MSTGFTPAMRNLLLGLGGLAVAGAAFSAYTLHARRGPAAAADVQVIAHGETVDLASHLARGKYTVFDFYAVWCPPCRVLGPALERLAERQPGRLAIRKVDIVDWTMPVAEQHRIESLPHLVLFDGDGNKVAEGDDVFPTLDRVFGESAREITELAGIEPQAAPAIPADHPAAPGT